MDKKGVKKLLYFSIYSKIYMRYLIYYRRYSIFIFPKPKFILLLITFMTLSLYAKEKMPVNVYVYHLKPPFITDLENKKGLYFDFSHYLNSKSENYHFSTTFIPRKRIEHMLENSLFEGVLLGVNPIWFKDKSESKYLWTQSIFADKDEVISLREKPVEYTTPSSLEQYRLGGFRGFYYYGINELVAQNKIHRTDTISEQALINMLKTKRIDCAIISRSTFNYITKENDNRHLFHISERPHDTYARKILILPKDKSIHHELKLIIEYMKKDKIWSELLLSYSGN